MSTSPWLGDGGGTQEGTLEPHQLTIRGRGVKPLNP